ncbi:hypothetical protein GCM10010399_63240 [Dactylosporangium fulvum]|uniref:Four helix bundle sensory module for signal transduction n=1 Tax=Dactylosporangium fulvum TaxID=53359 RepID=A0ABY5VP44_9ACTN|nr:hypothetical protein [Dactylosporangium fulvum]UWP79518.1 hypothetical protein Dfulv_30665 [Dactylosporangium fulvum]
MKRKTLDILVGLGGIVLAGLLLVAGIVLTTNANFANDYVTSQLGQQQITFKSADTLTAEERKSACLVEYAGQPLTTGKQAECYANEFIGLHLKTMAGGKTYAQLGDVQTELRAKVTAAQQANDPALADLQKQLADVTAQRETVFKGETLRGLLLTSYGFSEFGAKAAQAALVAYIASGLLFLLGVAGLVHAAATPGTKGFAVPERTNGKENGKELVDA